MTSQQLHQRSGHFAGTCLPTRMVLFAVLLRKHGQVLWLKTPVHLEEIAFTLVSIFLRPTDDQNSPLPLVVTLKPRNVEAILSRALSCSDFGQKMCLTFVCSLLVRCVFSAWRAPDIDAIRSTATTALALFARLPVNYFGQPLQILRTRSMRRRVVNLEGPSRLFLCDSEV